MSSWTVTLPSSSSNPPVTETWTNFGPLTTSFTPPASCKTDPAKEGLVVFTVTTGTDTSSSYDCGQANAHYIQTPACYPNPSGVSILQTNSHLYAGYWSPGLVCPSGWSTGNSWTYPAGASSTLGPVDNSIIGNPNLAATYAKCCPSGFTIDLYGYCARGVTTPTFGAMCDLDFHCTSNQTSASYICPTSPSPFTWSPAATDTQISITAYGILMVHQPTDMSLIDTSTPNPKTPSTPSTTPGSGGTGSGDTNPTPTPKGGGGGTPISTLVPAIVVPIVVLAAIIIGVIFALRARKRKARSKAYSGSSYAAPYGSDKDTVRSSVLASDQMGDRAEYYSQGNSVRTLKPTTTTSVADYGESVTDAAELPSP